MAAPAGGKDNQQKEDTRKGWPKLEDLGFVGTVLAAVGGSLGLLGLVAFFGAAIIWVRMDQAGLSGNEAVAVVPKSVLVATGASFLVPALLIALGFTVFLFLVYTVIERLGTRSLRKLEGKLEGAKREQENAERNIEALRKLASSARRDRDRAAAAAAAEAVPLIVEAQAEDRVRNTLEEITAASEQSVAAHAAAVRREAELKDEEPRQRQRVDAHKRGALIVATVLLFLALSAVMIAHYSVHPSLERIAVLVLLAVFLPTVCIAVQLTAQSFVWFAAVAFLAVGVMIGALTYYRTVDEPKVEPAALLRTHGPPLYGFYVAQTADRVYLGTNPPKGVNRLNSIPREEVVDLTVGSLQSPTAAHEHAIAFALRLCREARERKPTGRVAGHDGGGKTAEELASGCTKADLGRLERAS